MDKEKTTQTFDYDVFLSFRGLDTRKSFTDILYNAMVGTGIRVFRDDDELSAGQKIDEILLALENSNICMPIFSRILSLYNKLEIEVIPTVVAVGPTSEIVTREGKGLIEAYEADAYPFMEARYYIYRYRSKKQAMEISATWRRD